MISGSLPPSSDDARPIGSDPFERFTVGLESQDIQDLVQAALREDLGSGDLSAALVHNKVRARAELTLREPAVLCGQQWFESCFHAIDPGVRIHWRAHDGDRIGQPGVIAELSGPARALLTAERCALNFLQTLSGTATATARLVDLLREHGSRSRLLDTRKTLPGLRMAQKYAVHCAGGYNHRLGLWEAILIKENHIQACGSITEAVERARALGKGRWIEVETENLTEVEEALRAGVEVIMLDNFDLDALREAVARICGKAVSEASGGVSEDTLLDVAATGVDYISSGAITKNVRAIDLSLRIL